MICVCTVWRYEFCTMFLFCRRSFNIPPITVVILMMIFIIIMTKQVKDLYEKTQKNKRIHSYNEFLNEVSESMTDLEVSLNKSASSLHQLNSFLQIKTLIKRESKYLKIP